MGDLELIDCGDGRRLERFGDVVVDRPAPTAVMPRRLPAADWRRAALRWAGGAWARGAAKTPVDHRRVRASASNAGRPRAGRSALFPEHAATWGWLDGAVRGWPRTLERPPELLSLFGYTGGATLLAARAGARVAHVDASKPAVAWARRNAELSGLEDRPVRWLVDDVRDVRPARAPPRAPLRRGHPRSADVRPRIGAVEDRRRTSRRCSTTSPRSLGPRPGSSS